jgi:hypothetical protein
MERHPLHRRAQLDPPPAIPTARHFCIREVGVLAEQGVLDRARMLLARRAQKEPLTPDAFLDAIRLELSVPSSGSAWCAWVTRALEGGVEIADRIASIVPERELSRTLAEIAPGLLLQQTSRAAALDLLRARAGWLLSENDPRALDVLEDELIDAGDSDPELRALQVATLFARVFAAPEPVERHRQALAARLDTEQAAQLQREVELARAYHRLDLSGRLPPLDAALALFGRCDAQLDHNLQADLGRDLRARPSEYLAWADAVASSQPALLDTLSARLHTSLAATTSQPAEPHARSAALSAELARAIESDARRFVPLSASVLALYRKHARLKALMAITERAVTFEALAGAVRAHKGAARRALAHLEADAALRLVGRVAQSSTSASRGSDRGMTSRR